MTDLKNVNPSRSFLEGGEEGIVDSQLAKHHTHLGAVPLASQDFNLLLINVCF